MPSSHHNNRRVFNIVIQPQLLKYFNWIGVLAETEGLSTSYHLPFFIDIDRFIFDTKLGPLIPHQHRILRSTNAASVKKYFQSALDQIKKHNIHYRLRSLQKRINQHGFKQQESQELENIDSIVTSIRLQCEKKLVPSPTSYKRRI